MSGGQLWLAWAAAAVALLMAWCGLGIAWAAIRPARAQFSCGPCLKAMAGTGGWHCGSCPCC